LIDIEDGVEIELIKLEQNIVTEMVDNYVRI
jgi:hypothetical protein